MGEVLGHEPPELLQLFCKSVKLSWRDDTILQEKNIHSSIVLMKAVALKSVFSGIRSGILLYSVQQHLKDFSSINLFRFFTLFLSVLSKSPLQDKPGPAVFAKCNSH